MARPVILGIAGDSASGKTALTQGLRRALGEATVTHLCVDDYRRYRHDEEAGLRITRLDPDFYYLDIMTQHLALLREGSSVLKPVYDQANGIFAPAVYLTPTRYLIVEGLLAYPTSELRAAYDVRVYLAPPEALRRYWKVARDSVHGGPTTDELLVELDRCETDSASYVRPQKRYADIMVTFVPRDDGDPNRLDVELTCREGLIHPDLASAVQTERLMLLTWGSDARYQRIPGNLDADQFSDLEHAIRDRMHFATHLRSDRLGEFTDGGDLRHSESLALVQLMILCPLMHAAATLTPHLRAADHGLRAT
jgi:phosphoribulokinase